MNIDRVATQYTFEVSVPEFLKITDRDDEEQGKGWNTLSVRLEKCPGVEGVDYGGHFGPFIFLTIETEQDTPGYRKALSALIKNYAEGLEDEENTD